MRYLSLFWEGFKSGFVDGLKYSLALWIILFLLLSIMPVPAAAYRITGDGGGAVYDYGRRWDALRNDKIIVDGPCYSSCTMVLNNAPRVCVTNRAVFGFHRAYFRPGYIGPYITDEQATAYMWARIPRDVQRLIPGGLLKDRGGVFVPNLFMLKASQLPQRYRC